MNYTCIIVDDEALARELIETYISKIPNLELVASCKSAIEASEIFQENNVDLLFLDIEMPVLKGTEFFKNLLHKPKVIFTTAHRDYAIEGFELDAIDYLLKPIIFERFFKSIQKFMSSNNTVDKLSLSKDIIPKNDFLFVSKNRKQIKIRFKEVLYIESLKDYIKIHLKDKTHIIKYGISAFQKNLDARFIRVHRSYIVNTDKITAYTNNDIEIESIEIPIGKSYFESLGLKDRL